MEFDLEQVYRLVDVQDHTGRSKAESRALYRDRVGCLAKRLRICPGDCPYFFRNCLEKFGRSRNPQEYMISVIFISDLPIRRAALSSR